MKQEKVKPNLAGTLLIVLGVIVIILGILFFSVDPKNNTASSINTQIIN